MVVYEYVEGGKSQLKSCLSSGKEDLVNGSVSI